MARIGDEPQRQGSSGSCDILLLAAFGPELAPLAPAMGTLGDGTMAALLGGVSVVARACGIGLPTAAAFSALHIHQTRPAAVVLLGTCGAYAATGGPAETPAIGEVVVSRHIQLVDPLALEHSTQFPEAMGAPMPASWRVVDALVARGLRAVDIATTLAITVNDEVAERIARATGTHVEHLEAYGVATASAACGVPFAAVLGIANSVGARGRVEWRNNHLRASAAAADEVLRWIKEGGAIEALARA
jgi:futalosine hydrolase